MDIYRIRFTAAIVISILAHLILIFSTPEFMQFYSLPEEKEKIFEIDRIEETKPKDVKEKIEDIKQEEPKEMTKVADKESLQIPSSVEKVIDGEVKKIKLGENFTPPPPLISLPEVAREPSIINSPITFKKYIPPESIKKFEPEGSAMIGNVFGVKKDIPLPKIKAETKFLIKQPVVTDSFKAGREEIIGKEPEFKIRQENLKLGLKGEIVDRKIDNKPALPSVKIDIPTTVTLDFEVQPDGTVIKIRPQKRVDVNLERIAIDYLKNWKFSNLPMDAVQKNQIGTLIIKFELE